MTTLTAVVDLPITGHTVRDARTLVLGLADGWDSATYRVDLELLIDDLTADVVAHARGENDLRLELTCHGGTLHVAICDGSAVRPAVADTDGLLAVLADRWGHEPYQGGHRVWFELDALPAPEPEVQFPPALEVRLRLLLRCPVPLGRYGT
ncbi:hypothetical protein GCM10023201_32170 [Actinomycetospora corticicola]|uniref:ATP-binding protein n=1 Tax=Actinomycetospora corticicola TaxID=663602 RepID=A0A7Y9J534_9PSEU|nr:ATP-binding protein [Actinomycetospora corticicola]NYD35737.1 hypothetical protein [Actinomycetospora corticicola]